MNIINLTGHELDNGVLSDLEKKFDDVIVHTKKSTIRRSKPLFPQIEEMLQEYNSFLTGKEQPGIILPGLSFVAVAIVSFIHGKTGNFPLVIELVRNNESRTWTINEIHDLEYYRHKARRNG